MFRDNANKFNNPYGEPIEERGRWLQDHHNPSERAEILLFGGCTASYKMPPMLQSGASILQKVGLPYAYAGPNEACCGSPILRTGQLEAAKRVIGMNIDTFKSMGVKRIVSPCSGCAKTLKFDYPKWGKHLGKEFDIEVMHFVELYVKLLDEGKLKPKKPVNMTVTYHDPCHLGRSQSIYDEPRKILASIPGLKLVEMEYIRESAHCCGAGGGVRAQYTNIADDLATNRVKQAEATGADALVTMCPFCQSSFGLVKKKMDSKIEIHGVEDLFLRSL
jgi:heterodisulfide reductase subunit D